MKKTTLILAGIALIAASCAKTEVVSSGPDGAEKGISFSAYTARPTKAAQEDVTTAILTTFQATAIGNSAIYFDNVEFLKSSGTPTVWESSPAYFWPVYSLNFYAYNKPTNGTFTPTINTTTQEIKFSPSATLLEQEDLVAASAIGQSAPSALNGAINLQFHHYLTQVVVKAQCSNTNYTVKVDGVKLANLAGEGTYTFSTTAESTGNMVATESLKNSDSSSDYISTFNAKTLTEEAQEVMAEETGKWYLIPQTVKAWDRVNNMTNKDALSSTTSTYDHGTYLALKVMITMTNGSSNDQIAIYPKGESTSAWMAVPVPPQLAFEQGKKYNVTVDFFSSDQNNGGAGYVDPEEPGDLDGNGQTTDDSGKAIVGGVIKFNATVDTWDSNTVTVNISL